MDLVGLWRWISPPSRELLLSVVLLGSVGVLGWMNRRGTFAPVEVALFLVAALVFAGFIWLPWPRSFASALCAVYVGVLVVASSYEGPVWYLVLAVVFDVNTRRPKWFGAALAALMVAATTLDLERVGFAGFRFSVGAIIVFAVLGAYVRHQSELAHASGVIEREARDAERRAIAGEMHDKIASVMTQSVAVARSAQLQLADAGIGGEQLRTIEQLSLAGLEEVRKLARSLDGDRGTIPTGSADPRHAWQVATATLLWAGLDVTATGGDVWPRSQKLAEFASLVIGQATANILEHGLPGGIVRVMASPTHESLVLTFMNQMEPDGTGNGAAGMGIRSLKRAASKAGAKLDATAEDGTWTLRAVLPLQLG